MAEFIAFMQTGIASIFAVLLTAFFGWAASVRSGNKGEKKGREEEQNKQRVTVAETTTAIIKKDRKNENKVDGMSNVELLDSMQYLQEQHASTSGDK